MSFAFILKKVVSAFLMPLPIALIIFIIGFYFLYKKSYTKAKFFILFSIIFLSAISYAPFSNMLLAPLENKYPKLTNIPKDVKYIVFLGGDQPNRGWEVLRLYNNIKNAKIITSGYAGRSDIPEAIKTANILKNIGLNQNDIIIHPKPKDTKEEAIKIKEVLKNTKFILVTSAYHMPRAMMIFKSVGLTPIPAPSDFLIKSKDKILSLPKSYHLYKSKKAWHEYIGLLWLKIKS